MSIKFRSRFFTGLATLLPILLMYLILRAVYFWLNDPVLQPLANLLERIPGVDIPNFLMPWVKIFIGALVIFAFGWLCEWYFVKIIIRGGERVVHKIPMIGKFYMASKQLVGAFRGGRVRFAWFEYPRKGAWTVGPVMNEQKTSKGDMLCVFAPSSPNLITGYPVVVLKSEAHEFSLSVEEAIKWFVSGGKIAIPFPFSKELEERRLKTST